MKPRGKSPVENGARPCTAHTSSGKPCRNPAIAGGAVCRKHGGAAPQVLAAAKRRLLEAVDPAAAHLIDIALGRAKTKRVTKDGAEVEEPASPAVRVRAIGEILDRAGLPGVSRQEHTTPDGEPFVVVLDQRMTPKKPARKKDA